MKYLFLIITTILISDCTSKRIKATSTTIDTLQTKSGLQYYYLTKGIGPKVKRGSEVSTILLLKIKDSLIWTSYKLPDSAFTFIADFSGVIKGFNEMAMLLREGDQVVAIMPDSIAYGPRGIPGTIAPHATLVYDIFKVTKVKPPKPLMADTLLQVFNKKGFSPMIDKYNYIINSKDTLVYYTDFEQVRGLWRLLTNEQKHEEALQVADYFTKFKNDRGLRFCRVRSYENLRRFQQASDSLRVLLELDPKNTRYQDKLAEIEEKIQRRD